jgi:UDP-N-acetylmuramoyl-tripeptide--D-alanyl-D-alanine ligase
MDKMELHSAATAMHARSFTHLPAEPVTGISIDSRTIKPGNLYFALQGERFDGHAFVSNALDKGAVAAVVNSDFKESHDRLLTVEDPLSALQDLAGFHRDRLAIPIIGIIGSHGKTTSKDIAASVFRQRYRTACTFKNLNGLIGVPLTLLAIDQMHEFAIIETGISKPGEMDVLGSILKPTGVITTCFACSHTEYLKDLAGITKEKSRLFEYLIETKLRVLNADDVNIMQSYDAGTSLTWGFESGQYRCREATLSANSSQFTVIQPGELPSMQFSLPLPGKHNISNALPVIALARHFGFEPEEIQRGFNGIDLSPHRSRVISTKGITLIDDSYNAAPLSMEISLDMLKSMAGSKRSIAVLGDMLELGDVSITAHKKIGKLVSNLNIDLLLCYGPWMKYTAETVLKENGTARYFTTRHEITKDLLETIQPGDTILIKSSNGLRSCDIVTALLDELDRR